MKKYVLEVYINEDNGLAVREKTDDLRLGDLRLIMSVFEQVKLAMLTQLSLETKPINDKVKKEIKAD